MKGLQDLDIPITGDDAAIKKYAQEVENLRKKVGMPEYEDMIKAQLDYTFACSGFNARKFVANALQELQVESGDLEGIGDDINAAIDAAESGSGAELSRDNEKGWAILTKHIAEIEKKYGFTNKKKVREEAVFEMYKDHITDLKNVLETELEKVKKAENSNISVDLSKLKPSLI